MMPPAPGPVAALARSAADLASARGSDLRCLRNNALLVLSGVAAGLLTAGLLLGGRGLPAAALVQALLLYALLVAAVLLALPRHLPNRRFGLANGITLGRAALICLLAGLIGRAEPASFGWLPFIAALTVLCLDGLDGWAARHYGSASSFGSWFDMEVDGLFLILLCLLLVAAERTGAWVLVAVLPRYLFVAAGRLRPWLRRELPPRFARKLAFVAASLLLLAGLAPPLTPAVAAACAAAAVILIVASFTLDLAWLYRRRGAPS